MATFTYQILNAVTGERSIIAWDRDLGQVWGPTAGAIRAKAKECDSVVLTISPGIIDSVSPHLKSDHGLLCLLHQIGWEFAPRSGQDGATSPS